MSMFSLLINLTYLCYITVSAVSWFVHCFTSYSRLSAEWSFVVCRGRVERQVIRITYSKTFTKYNIPKKDSTS